MKKVLLIGNCARENAIGEALVIGGAELFAFMGKNNPGIVKLCKYNDNVKIGSLDNFSDIIDFAKEKKVDFALIGPEAPLAMGISNALETQGIPTIGPTIECAQLESSKIFMRNLLKKFNIESNIEYEIFNDMKGIKEFVRKIGKEKVVIKPDGLTGGKGVKVWGDHLNTVDEIYKYCLELFDKGGRVIIEEKLEGEEFTYICFVDGKHVVGTPIVQDNKRAYNNDEGPNTGGMGSYSMSNHLMPFISESDVEYSKNQIEQVVAAILEETKQKYKGFLYGQFMKTANGIKVVEFNIRLGDPEAVNILPIMRSNFLTVCQQILDGNLKGPLEYEKKATVCKYLVPEGYPINPQAHEEIKIDKENLKKLGVKLYYASVSKKNSRIFTSTSRAIAILGIADTIQEAEQLAEKGTQYIKGNLFHRTDIGTQLVINKRTKHMKSILNRSKN